MNTYNLTSVSLHTVEEEQDCFCALGVYLAEKGFLPAQIDKSQYALFTPDDADDLKKMAEALGTGSESWDEYPYPPIYRANDHYDWDAKTKTATYKYTAAQFEEAFKAIGMDVTLNDVRGDKWKRQAAKASGATST